MFNIGNLYFSIEILLAELIFLYSCPKRKRFWLRYAVSVAVCLALSYLFPTPSSLTRNNLYMLARFLILFGYTVCAMAVCFDLKFVTLLSNCTAGYAVQHIAYQVTFIITSLTSIYSNLTGANRSSLAELTFFPLIYLVLFLGFGLFAAKNKSYKNNDVRLLVLSICSVLLIIGFSRLAVHFNERNTVTRCFYAIVCCLLTLIIQFSLYKVFELMNENRAIHILRQEEKRQYEISKNAMDLVNIKYHDLKHRLSSESLSKEEQSSLRETLKLYDESCYRTGTEVLDVILTESSLHNGANGIEITFMGNGGALSFMSVSDIYSLFGNALENAIEAVKKLDDNEKKVVGVSIEDKGDMLIINVTNYFDGKIEIQDGLPVTSKDEEEGYHGFGMKSIKLIAQKYHGEMKVSTEDELFNLNVWLMK